MFPFTVCKDLTYQKNCAWSVRQMVLQDLLLDTQMQGRLGRLKRWVCGWMAALGLEVNNVGAGISSLSRPKPYLQPKISSRELIGVHSVV